MKPTTAENKVTDLHECASICTESDTRFNWNFSNNSILQVSVEQVSIKGLSREIDVQSVHEWKRLSHKSFNSSVWVGPTDIRYVYSDAETSRLNRRPRKKRLDLTLICYKQRSYIILHERAFAPFSVDLHKRE